jgi:hypothetical protein
MSPNTYRRELADLAQQFGWAIERTAGGHLKLIHPHHSQPIFCSHSASDWRTLKDIRAQLKRVERRTAA